MMWKLATIASSMAGLIVGAVMMSIAWIDNPQGEFHDDGVIHWGAWTVVGLSWFAGVSTCLIVPIRFAVARWIGTRSSDAA